MARSSRIAPVHVDDLPPAPFSAPPLLLLRRSSSSRSRAAPVPAHDIAASTAAADDEELPPAMAPALLRKLSSIHRRGLIPSTYSRVKEYILSGELQNLQHARELILQVSTDRLCPCSSAPAALSNISDRSKQASLPITFRQNIPSRCGRSSVRAIWSRPRRRVQARSGAVHTARC